MGGTNRFSKTFADGSCEKRSRFSQLAGPSVNVPREGRVEAFLERCATKPSAEAPWGGITLENYTVPAVLICRHEHPETLLHLVLKGVVKYEVNTRARNLRFSSCPGKLFLLPPGTAEEVNWTGPDQHLAVAIDTGRLTRALEETAHQAEFELTEHWDLIDRQISALLVEMMADLDGASPAETINGESLANALAVYLVKHYAVQQISPTIKGGLPGKRLKRVLDYIESSLDENISLAQLAGIAGMSPHYFAELFKLSTGRAPHKYVLMQRIERAKHQLRDPRRSIIDAGLQAGFQNPSHFARAFRKIEGTTPSAYRAEHLPRTSR